MDFYKGSKAINVKRKPKFDILSFKQRKGGKIISESHFSVYYRTMIHIRVNCDHLLKFRHDNEGYKCSRSFNLFL